MLASATNASAQAGSQAEANQTQADGAQVLEAITPEPTNYLLNLEETQAEQTIFINQSYTDRWGGSAKAPFRFDIAQSDQSETLYHPHEEGQATLLRVSFVDQAQNLIENIRFIPMELSMGETDQRLQAMADTLTTEVFPTFTQGFEDVRILGTRGTKVHYYDAVELAGTYIDPDVGLIYLRMVGIINPDSHHTILAISGVVDTKISLRHPDQFALTRGGYALSTFEFLID